MDTDNSNRQPNKKFSAGSAWIFFGLVALVAVLAGFVIYQQRVNSRLSRDLIGAQSESNPNGASQEALSQAAAETPAVPVNTMASAVAEKPAPAVVERPAPAVRAYSNLRAAKDAYKSGKISKSEYKSIVQRLKDEKEQKINRVKADYKSGKITKSEYKSKIAAIKSQYE